MTTDEMIIDFHAHAFTDSLAPRAIGELLEKCGRRYTPVSDGTLSGLLRNMDEWGIDVSVLQPVITKPSQVRAINEWVRGCCSERIAGFGGIYPHSSGYRDDIDFVADLGLKGLKFHPEYQDFILDDRPMLDIYAYALEKGLMLLFHAGYDPGFPPPFKSDPLRFASVVKAMGGGTIIAAHLGGHGQWDGVERHLAGTGIYLDTSMGFGYYPPDQFLRIVQKHGADKILFGSDAPWSDAGAEMARLKALPLPRSAKEAILGGNGRRLLGLL